ncbi:PilN domain-containing protein [Dissulfurirhabdus thermomarina]|uniref:PilN domain-containing protein n=1 Tax=Dissulfurirhabdus thermomarina TaxID=1765737 RepID=A0A6N9TQJ2_DISTH|nr:PilN domain-containing protein [Dissulfurirhabdus thermomarina]NDY43541.1 PilN domain-containing protein [Dissulfurirhabdus thermomarina]NMX22503.1 PilN domain-containing protein [Dissulfurirhabdus thermomarina]
MRGEREILGIHLGRELEVVRLRGRGRSWRPALGPAARPEDGRPALEQLRRLLEGLAPARRRRIVVTLPRPALFLREIRFPDLEPGEALSAVRLGIGLHAHLEPEALVHDEVVLPGEGATRVLLAYAPRHLVDPVLRVLGQTGHARSLHALAPATLGVDAVLRRAEGVAFPCLGLHREGAAWILSLHGREGWEGSHPLDVPEGASPWPGLAEVRPLLPTAFQAATVPVFLGPGAGEVSGEAPPGARHVPSVAWTALGGEGASPSWALGAAALARDPFPAISLHGGPRRPPLRLRLRLRPRQAAAVGGALALGLATLGLGLQVERLAARVAAKEAEVAAAEARIAPLRKTHQEAESLRATAEALAAFRAGGIPALETLKVLAEATPPETWIKSLHMKEDRIRLTAEGGSAVDVMGLWRAAGRFSEVRLVSPVTKDRRQRERFSVELVLAAPGGRDGG